MNIINILFLTIKMNSIKNILVEKKSQLLNINETAMAKKSLEVEVESAAAKNSPLEIKVEIEDAGAK